MAVQHFLWRGKERSVSILRKGQNVRLLFLDEEVIESLGKNSIEFSMQTVGAHSDRSTVEQELIEVVLAKLQAQSFQGN